MNGPWWMGWWMGAIGPALAWIVVVLLALRPQDDRRARFLPAWIAAAAAMSVVSAIVLGTLRAVFPHPARLEVLFLLLVGQMLAISAGAISGMLVAWKRG